MIAGVSLVIPAFNEESAVADVVTRFRSELDATGCIYEVIVVDDGSTDETARLAKEAGASVVCSPQNLGYGLSLRRGILAAKFDYVMICDADGTYPSESVGELTSMAEHMDMVVAARTGKHFRGRGPRAIARAGLRLFASFVVGRYIPDVNSGFRIFRKSDCLRYFGILSDARAVAFVPVPYAARIGKSKVRPLRDTMRIGQVLVQAMVRHNPIKLFFTITAGIWALGLALFVVWVVTGSVIAATATIAIFLVGVQIFCLGLLAEALRARAGEV